FGVPEPAGLLHRDLAGLDERDQLLGGIGGERRLRPTLALGTTTARGRLAERLGTEELDGLGLDRALLAAHVHRDRPVLVELRNGAGLAGFVETDALLGPDADRALLSRLPDTEEAALRLVLGGGRGPRSSV